MAKRTRQRERGVALLIVVVAIAILTAVAAEFAYNQRVDLQMAANQRDALKAEYQARSGIAMSRLLLRFQKQLDSIQLPNLSGLLSQFMGGGAAGAGGAPGAAAAAAPTSLNIQIWRAAKVDCHLTEALMPGVGSGGKFGFDEADETKAKPVDAGPSGCFDAQISDEEEKLNLNQLDAPELTGRAAATRMLQLFSDKRFEFLFEDEDANRVKTTPQDLLIAIKDWVDEDQTQSALNLTGQGEVFQNGFSDENGSYDRYTPRYQAKNARFDTLDELYMVHGVNDRIMAAFGDKLTVYPDINARLNVNTDDPMMLYLAILSVADPNRPDPRLQNPVFVQDLIAQIRQARMFSFIGMSVPDFVNVVQAAGVAVNASITQNVQNNRFVSDKSSTFRIESTGSAGQVTRKISAVVRLDSGLGKLMYWRED
jgi:general secretion pathway protein K